MKIPGGFIDQSVQIPVTLPGGGPTPIFAAILAYKWSARYSMCHTVSSLCSSAIWRLAQSEPDLGFK